MSEEEHDSELLSYIKQKMEANKKHAEYDGKLKDYYEGANTALEELAVHFGIVAGYGEI